MEAMNVYPIRNSKGEGGNKKEKKKKKKVTLTNSRKHWAEFSWVYKLGLQCPVIAMAITLKPHCLSVSP